MKFVYTQRLKNLNDTFDHWSIDGKSGFTLHLVAELKLKMSLFADLTFSILALPPDSIFPFWPFTFPIYGPLVKKVSFKFLIHCKGAVHILGEICPRSDPDIADMRYYLGPLQLCKYGPHLNQNIRQNVKDSCFPASCTMYIRYP